MFTSMAQTTNTLKGTILRQSVEINPDTVAFFFWIKGKQIHSGYIPFNPEGIKQKALRG
jgi:hypothetical protein